MKIAIIQLSDLHCRETDRNLTLKLEKAIRAIQVSSNIDKAILLISGDLVDTSTSEEYKVAKHLIGKFLRELGDTLKCGKIITKIVPGNHDMFLPLNSRSAEIITTWEKQDHLDDEIKRMDEFFSYSSTKSCFRKNKIYDVETCVIGDSKIQFCLLNSAPFSTRQPTDKQLHYLPSEVGEHIQRQEDADLKITVMHHHFEWCEWQTKEMVKKAIQSDDVTFFGHDHKAESYTTKYTSGITYNVIMGGRFNLACDQTASFNMVVYDSQTKVIERFQFDWSVNDSIFIPQRLPVISCKNTTIAPSNEFLDELLSDKQNIASRFTDYYVFPKLQAEGDAFFSDTKQEEIDIDKIFSALEKERVVRITGGNGSGKTTLIKYLYYCAVDKGYIPLIISKGRYNDSRIDKMFEKLFGEQYSNHAYHSYVQEDDAKKIVFIDDVDLIKNSNAKENLLFSILDSGKLLIYTTREKNQDLEEIVKDKLQEKSISTLNILPVYKQTRDAMIENVGALNHKDTGEIDAIKMALDYMVQCQTAFFNFTPDNILQYIKFLMREGVNDQRGTQKISMVFENNIRNSILEACPTEGNANLYLLALEYLADNMYFVKQKEKIDIATFSEIIDAYNRKRKSKINSKQFLEACINAHILKQANDSFDISFYDKNTFAYFVAKAINTEFGKNPADMEKIGYVMNHICFGINDTIVLFLSFITSNIGIILRIADKAEQLLADRDEWSIDTKNIPFLHEVSGMPKGIPSKQEKKKNHEKIERIERARHEQVIEFRDIFDHTEDDVKKDKFVVLKALKFTQLLGRALIDQYGAFDEQDVDRIIDIIYSVPQKVIFAILKETQDKLQLTIQNILNFVQENLPGEKIDEKMIRQLLSQAGTILALNILNDIAYNCANDTTIGVLREKDTKNSNHEIMKLMMEENVGNTDVFIDRAIDAMESFDGNPYARMIVSQIARKHLIHTTNVDHRQIDKLISGKVLSSKSKSQLLLSQGKKEAK